jgi:serine/threonine protein phosphatase PrpC
MEDTFVAIDQLEQHLPKIDELLQNEMECGRHVSFHAVYDGHGGHRASYYLRNHLHRTVLESDALRERKVDIALHHAFVHTDTQLLKRAEEEDWKAGSTAVASVLIDDYLFVANTGDSELVLGRRRRRRKRVHAYAHAKPLTAHELANPPWAALRCPKSPGHDTVVLSSKHQLDDEGERKRVIDLGGVITGRRLFGDLAVSRGFGDRDYKRPRAVADYITVEPALKMVCLTDQDEFIVMASDGLWDVVSHQEAVDFISAYLEKKASSQRSLASPLALPTAEERFDGHHPYTDDAGAMPVGLRDDIAPTCGGAEKKAEEAAVEVEKKKKKGDDAEEAGDGELKEKQEAGADGKEEKPKKSEEDGEKASIEEESGKEEKKQEEVSEEGASSPATTSKRQMLTKGGGMRGLAAMGGGGGGKGNIRALVRNKKPKFQAAKLNLLPLEQLVSPDTTAAAKLANLALERGSKDNITVLIVFFNWEEQE